MNSFNSPTAAEFTAMTMSGFDDVGQVFFYRGKILRGIYLQHIGRIRQLLKCGLIQELHVRGMFPKTEIAHVSIPDFELTIEHERLHPLVLPSEWTFGMFRDAALTLLEINNIARSFGYETKDAHLYNLCFVATRPIFFDLGSFVPVDRENSGWRGYEGFVRAAWYPLMLSRHGGPLLHRMLMDHCAEHDVSHEEYFRLRLGGIATWFPHPALARVRKVYGKFLRIGILPEDQILSYFSHIPGAKLIVNMLRNSVFFPYLTANFASLQRSIRRLKSLPNETVWMKYQQELLSDDGLPKLDVRYERICEILAGLKIESAVELGGNMGVLSLALHLRGIARQITCTDSDENAVEKAYELFGRFAQGGCTAAIVDLISNNRSIKVPAVSERLRSDAVVALALTHHLILSQGLSCQMLMQRISDFCTQYALIEFMPLGLWNGRDAPETPSWYTVDWFRHHFLASFDPVLEEQLEANRILFVGKKRP